MPLLKSIKIGEVSLEKLEQGLRELIDKSSNLCSLEIEHQDLGCEVLSRLLQSSRFPFLSSISLRASRLNPECVANQTPIFHSNSMVRRVNISSEGWQGSGFSIVLNSLSQCELLLTHLTLPSIEIDTLIQTTNT